jgi:hypothetical protein
MGFAHSGFDGVEREFNQFLLNDQELLNQYFKASSNPGLE